MTKPAAPERVAITDKMRAAGRHAIGMVADVGSFEIMAVEAYKAMSLAQPQVAQSVAVAKLMRLAEVWANAAEQLGMDRCNYATSGQHARQMVADAKEAFRTFAATLAAGGK